MLILRGGIYMHKGKRIVSIFLSVVLCAVSFFGIYTTSAAAATSGSCGASGSSVNWSYNSDTKQLTISGSGDIKNYGVTVLNRVPWYDYRGECTSLVIEEGVTGIGDRAFYQMAVLESASLPSTLTVISDYAFSECPNLASVNLPQNLTTIRAYAFYQSGITSVVFPDSLTSIGRTRLGNLETGFTFAECPDLESVTFGAGLTDTGLANFRNSGVKYVDFGSGITTVGEWSFYGSYITSVELPENITTVGMRAFSEIPTLYEVYVYNSECSFEGLIGDDPFAGSQQSLTFYGHSQSTTQTYAEEHSYNFVSIDPCSHENMYENITVQPTCETEGEKQIICSDCGAVVRVESVAALGHDYVTIETEDKTQIDGHLYEYQACTRCQKENTVATHNEWVEGYYTETYTIEPTCTTGGLVSRTCTICGQRSIPTIAPAKGHNVENYTEQVLPTCTEDGYRTGTCTACGQVVTVTIPASGHTNELVSSNTTDDGHTYNVYHCSVCGTDTQECIHNEWLEGYYTEDVVSQATCTSMGTVERKCTICGETQTENIMPTGHNYDGGVVTKEPTCTEPGTTTYTCQNCGNSYNIPILALGHDYSIEVILQEPTCTSAGTGSMQCSRCTAATTYEIPALGHNIEEAADYTVVSEPTCTEAGTASGTCANCGQIVEVEIPAAGHSYDSENAVIVTEPTCTETGTAVETCTVCGAQNEVAVPAKGHSYHFTEITTGTFGTRLNYVCDDCGGSTDAFQTTVQAGFLIYMNAAVENVTNGYMYDVNNDGYITVRDYSIVKGYFTIN